jgi:hypothetical protein
VKEKKGAIFCIATIGLSLLAFNLVYFSIVWGRSVEYFELSLVEKILAFSGVVGFFSFWFSVLAHFFGNRNLNHKVFWGFCLIFFSWLAALIYYLIHFTNKAQIPEKSKPGTD